MNETLRWATAAGEAHITDSPHSEATGQAATYHSRLQTQRRGPPRAAGSGDPLAPNRLE
jgi:hypothetical protein